MIVLSFFGFGLLLSFTPCVFPMIPILSGIIVGRGHHLIGCGRGEDLAGACCIQHAVANQAAV